MAAKKKSLSQVSEPVVAEEEQAIKTDAHDTTDTVATDTPVTDTPATDDTEVKEEDEEKEVVNEEDTEEEKKTPAHEEPEMEEQTHNTQASQPSDFFGNPEPKSGGGFPKALLGILALLLVGGGVAGFMFLKSGGQFLGVSTEASPSPTLEEELLPAPEPSPEAEVEDVDLTEFTVQVLNGSGTPGEAGEAKTLLEEAGFEEVETGNAPSQAAKVTTVSAKSGTPKAVVEAIVEALEGDFKVETDSDLEEDSEYDVVVTTGGATSGDATGSAEEE